MPAIARIAPDPGRGSSPGRSGLRAWPELPLLAAVLAWGLAAAWVAALSYGSMRGGPRMIDLGVYRTAGQNVLSGQPVYVAVSNADLPKLGRSLLVFTYPPISAVLSVPLALFTRLGSQIAWIAAVYIPLGVAIAIAFRPLIKRARRYGPAVAGLVFAVSAAILPMRDEIGFGQVDMLLAAFCVADVGVRHPRWPRGLLIGLAAAVKLTPAVFLVYLLITGRRRAAITGAVSAVAFTAMAWAIIPSASAYYWTNAIFDPRRLGRNAQISNQSIRGMMLRVFLPGAPPTWLWPVLAVPIAVAGFALARRSFRRGNDIAGVAMVGLLAVLISPVSWIHHLVWVVVALGAILGDGRSWSRLLAVAAGAAFFITASPYQGRVSPGILGPDLPRILWQDSYGIAAAALLLILAFLPPQRAAPPEPELQPPWRLDDPTAAFLDQPVRAGH